MTDEEALRMRLALVGALIIVWTHVESLIDQMNELIFTNGGKSSIQKKIPQNFSEKLKFFKEGHRTLPWLNSLTAQADMLISLASDHSAERHHLVHGIARNITSRDIDLVIVRNQYTAEGIKKNEVLFSPDKFTNLSTNLIQLIGAMDQHLDLMQELLNKKFT
ncbi:hypothetical protein [Blastomonas sp.]|uniref:hypothetical protein n=1 Tax=Blastomonas sp. TaxID=1909299 RepID=UPI003919C11E